MKKLTKLLTIVTIFNFFEANSVTEEELLALQNKSTKEVSEFVEKYKIQEAKKLWEICAGSRKLNLTPEETAQLDDTSTIPLIEVNNQRVYLTMILAGKILHEKIEREKKIQQIKISKYGEKSLVISGSKDKLQQKYEEILRKMLKKNHTSSDYAYENPTNKKFFQAISYYLENFRWYTKLEKEHIEELKLELQKTWYPFSVIKIFEHFNFLLQTYYILSKKFHQKKNENSEETFVQRMRKITPETEAVEILPAIDQEEEMQEMVTQSKLIEDYFVSIETANANEKDPSKTTEIPDQNLDENSLLSLQLSEDEDLFADLKNPSDSEQDQLQPEPDPETKSSKNKTKTQTIPSKTSTKNTENPPSRQEETTTKNPLLCTFQDKDSYLDEILGDTFRKHNFEEPLLSRENNFDDLLGNIVTTNNENDTFENPLLAHRKFEPAYKANAPEPSEDSIEKVVEEVKKDIKKDLEKRRILKEREQIFRLKQLRPFITPYDPEPKTSDKKLIIENLENLQISFCYFFGFLFWEDVPTFTSQKNCFLCMLSFIIFGSFFVFASIELLQKI